MIYILSLLIQWAQGKHDILNKIQILPVKNLYEEYEKDIQSTFGRNDLSTYGVSIMSTKNERRRSIAYRKSKTQEEFIQQLKSNIHKHI